VYSSNLKCGRYLLFGVKNSVKHIMLFIVIRFFEFKTSNTIWHHLNFHPPNKDTYQHSVIYELSCHTCSKKYMGQIGCFFETQYEEHTWSVKTSNNSKYTQHIINNQHTCGLVENTVKILHVTTKGYCMNTLEIFHIYTESQNKGINSMTYLLTALIPSLIPSQKNPYPPFTPSIQ
jgi:hypothetical protein